MYLLMFWRVLALAWCMHHAMGMISSNNHVETNDLVRDAREDHRQPAIILGGTATGGETENHTTIPHPNLRDWLPKEGSMLGIPAKDAPAEFHPDTQAAIGVDSGHSSTEKNLLWRIATVKGIPIVARSAKAQLNGMDGS